MLFHNQIWSGTEQNKQCVRAERVEEGWKGGADKEGKVKTQGTKNKQKKETKDKYTGLFISPWNILKIRNK